MSFDVLKCLIIIENHVHVEKKINSILQLTFAVVKSHPKLQWLLIAKAYFQLMLHIYQKLSGDYLWNMYSHSEIQADMPPKFLINVTEKKKGGSELYTSSSSLHLEVIHATFTHKLSTMTSNIAPCSLTRIRTFSPVMFWGAKNWEYVLKALIITTYFEKWVFIVKLFPPGLCF